MKVTTVQISSFVFNREKYAMQVWNSMRVGHFSILKSLHRPIVLLRFVCNSLFIYHFHCGFMNVSVQVFLKQITEVKADQIFCLLFFILFH